MPDTNPSADTKHLAEDLAFVQQTGLWRLGDQPANLPNLLRTLGSGLTASDLEDVLKEACQRIPQEQLRERALILFGLKPGLRGRNPRDLTAAVKTRFGETTNNHADAKAFGRRNRAARLAVAEHLRRPLSTQPENDTDILQIIKPIKFVMRSREYNSILTLIRENVSTLVISGDSGNGTSRLAKEALRAYCTEVSRSYIHLDASTRTSLLMSLAAYIDPLRQRDSSATLDDEIAMLIQKTSQVAPRPIVLVDNISDWSDARLLLSTNSIRLVLVAEFSEVPQSSEHAIVKVGAMTLDQASQLADEIDQYHDRELLQDFIELVGGKPLLITNLLGMLPDAADLADLCTSLKHSPEPMVGKGGISRQAVIG